MMAIIKDWVWLGTAVSPILIGIGMLYLRSQFSTKAEAASEGQSLKASIIQLSAQMEERHDDTDRRLAHLEATTAQLPSRNDIVAIERRVGEVERYGAVTAETVRGIDRMVTKIDHTLDTMLHHQLQESRS